MHEYATKAMRKRILFVTNYPSPYRVDFFNAFGSRDGIDLTVVFLERSGEQKHRSPDWFHEDYSGFRAVFPAKRIPLPGGAFICPEVVSMAGDGYDAVIMGGIDYPTSMLAMEYMRFRHIRYWIEGDGGFAKDGKGLKERVKRHFISGAKLCLSTGDTHDRYYLRYGAPPSSIFRYPLSSLREKDILPRPRTVDEKRAIRKALGLTEDRIAVSVGRFSYQGGCGKGYDVLVKACTRLPKNVGVYIIGDEPPDAFLRIKAQNRLEQLHFVGFRKKEELFQYYAAADLFVLLSRGEAWGLVVNEAMANALPVVTTDRCIAGLELVRDGENGYIVPVGNVNASAKAIQKALAGDMEQMGKRSLEIIQNYTIEKMADVHAEIVFRFAK